MGLTHCNIYLVDDIPLLVDQELRSRLNAVDMKVENMGVIEDIIRPRAQTNNFDLFAIARVKIVVDWSIVVVQVFHAQWRVFAQVVAPHQHVFPHEGV